MNALHRKFDDPMYRLALLELFAENTEEAFVLVDGNGLVVFTNPTFHRLFGWEVEELHHRKLKLHDLVHQHYSDGSARPATDCAFHDVMREKTEMEREEVWFHKDGTPVHVKTLHVPLIQNGSVVGVLTTIRDVRATFYESERRFVDVANTAPVLIWVADCQGNRVFVNQCGCEFVGANPAEDLSNKWLEFIHPEDRLKMELAQAEPSPRPWEFRLRRADGEYRWILATVAPRFIGEVERPLVADIHGFITVGIDITERREYEQTIASDEAALRRSNLDLEQFAYTASHDLQEPLRMVSNFMQLIQEHYSSALDDEGREWVGYAVEGSNRMSLLINGLLQYSRAGRGEQAAVDLQAVFDSVVDGFQMLIAENKAEVTSGKLPLVVGDASQLTNVFSNLIANAIKYRHPDRAPVISVSSSREGDYYHLKVRDNGIGIAPEHYELVFQLFKRLHSGHEYPGTGIGLTITQRVVERHGGKIWVESVLGVGTVFHFTLPATTFHPVVPAATIDQPAPIMA